MLEGLAEIRSQGCEMEKKCQRGGLGLQKLQMKSGSRPSVLCCGSLLPVRGCFTTSMFLMQ